MHFAAGIALCRNAGCIVTHSSNGPLETGRGLIAAADAEMHKRVICLMAPHLTAIDHAG